MRIHSHLDTAHLRFFNAMVASMSETGDGVDTGRPLAAGAGIHLFPTFWLHC
jgi:hypothetical protein